MRTSADGIKLIKDFEGERLGAYLCPAGVWTIGYGHTDAAGPPKVTPGMVITKREAEEILRKDLIKYENAVTQAANVPLKQHQFDALVSLCYNIGPGAFRKSTLVRKLNRGEYDAIPAELMKWNKANGRELAGLTRRRRAEAALWRKIDDAPVSRDETAVRPDAPKPKKTIAQSREANAAVAGGAMSLLAAGAEATGNTKQIADSFELPLIIVLVVVALVFAAIWWFRRQRLEETGE
jgi:lysozyme